MNEIIPDPLVTLLARMVASPACYDGARSLVVPVVANRILWVGQIRDGAVHVAKVGITARGQDGASIACPLVVLTQARLAEALDIEEDLSARQRAELAHGVETRAHVDAARFHLLTGGAA